MELMDPGTQLAFLWRLVNATESGSVEWMTLGDDFRFGTRVGRFAYIIRSADQDDVAPFVFSIFRIPENATETAAVPAQAEELAEWITAQYSPLNDALRALYMEVKPRVLGFHTVAGDMFEDLAKVDGGSQAPETHPLPGSDVPPREMPF